MDPRRHRLFLFRAKLQVVISRESRGDFWNFLARLELILGFRVNTYVNNLILSPFQRVDRDSFLNAGIVLVIDALDECDNGESIKTILLLLSRVEAITSVRLRIFVTSRPELPVELGFTGMSGYLHYDIRLEEA